MQYPINSEYVRAITDAEDNLDQLRHLVVVKDDHGEPYRSSGAFAVVFKMRDPQTDRCYALKCFTDEQQGRAEAYQMISEELSAVDSRYLTSVNYLEKELFVDNSGPDEEFPVLLMDWVEGITMDDYVATYYRDQVLMGQLCYRFCRMAVWLRTQPFAHGDLKPDNIIVRPDGSLTLVDYDGMFVPALAGQQSPTLGTRDFTHPQRTPADFDETIDDFSLASIALSLKAISLSPALLDQYGASGRLLFSADDYRDIAHCQVLVALQPLLSDSSLATLYGLFLLAMAQKNLAYCSFRLFDLPKPKGISALTPFGSPAVSPVVAPCPASILTFTVNGVSFDMVRVEGGTFTMGATAEQENEADDDEKPAHEVTLGSYYIGKTEVTQALWEAVMGNNPSRFKGSNRPVECVSWDDCQSFIAKLNEKTGKKFRLPTEAEWEYAARGGNKSQGYQYAGSNNFDEVAWYGGNSGNQTHDVGTKRPNELGIYDMSGNVWEWCSDWYGDYSSASQTNPTGPSSGANRVLRGGSWSYNVRNCRVSYRFSRYPGLRGSRNGLRLRLIS